MFLSATELTLHVKAKHLPNGDEQELRTAVSLGESAAPTDTSNQCPVCGSTVSGLKKYIKHVGRHLEQLALFALPSLEEQNPVEDAASDEQISAQSSLDVRSQSTSQAGSLIIEEKSMALPEEEEEEEEDASLIGDNTSIQEAYLVQARAEKRPATSGSTSEDFKDIGSSAVMQNISVAKEDEIRVIDDRVSWFRREVASFKTSSIQLVLLIRTEARLVKGAPPEGSSWKGIIRVSEQMVKVARREVDELKSFPKSHDLRGLSPEEVTQLLETINVDRMKLDKTLAEVELSFSILKARVSQKGVSHAEDTGEMPATLVDLEGKISESSESSAYDQPIMNMVSMRHQAMALRKSMAALMEARAKRGEENATIEEDTVRREKEIATKHTEAPLSTQEYEAEIGPKQPVADAPQSLNLEDDKTIARGGRREEC